MKNNNSEFITGLLNQRITLMEQLEHVNAMLKFYGIDVEENDKDVDKLCPYKKNATYKDKLGALLKQKERFLSINEMAALVNEYEPSITLEEAKKGLQSAKNLMLRDNSIGKFQYDGNNSNTFYGSPSWLNEDGKPKEKYMYDENALRKKEIIEI
jgi:hypothetical protein